MRRLFYPTLLASCFAFCSCTAFQEENRKFFSVSPDRPGELRFNVPARGYIRSPYDPAAGLVDVRGIPPGTSVICPYTGRVFVVPAYDYR